MHICTEGFKLDDHTHAGAGIHSELFLCYKLLGQPSTAYDGEIEGIYTALQQLCAHIDKFEKAVIYVDSKAAILSVGSLDKLTSTTVEERQAKTRQLQQINKKLSCRFIG